MKRDDNQTSQLGKSGGGRATSRRQTGTSIRSEVGSRSSWKILILFGVLISLIFLIFAAPQIEFVNPTPPDNNITTNNWIYVNVTISGGDTSFINWNNSLVGWWRMNNESGENESYVADWGGNGNNGTVTGATYNASGGKFGGSFEFDGVGDYIDVSSPQNLYFDSDDSFTLSVYVKTNDSVDTFMTIITTDQWDGYSLVKYYGNFGLRLGSSTVRCTVAVQYGNFSHLTYVVDRNNVSGYGNNRIIAYKNGTYVTDCDAGEDELSHSYFRIGGDSTWIWNGTIDDVKIFSRALKTNEIPSLYNSTSPLYNNFTSLSNGNYTYTVYSQNGTGDVNSSSRSIIVYLNPSVTLNYPLNNRVTSNTSVDFNCSASVNNNVYSLSNVTFYTNYSGNWQSNGTNSFSGTSNYTNFTKSFSINDKSLIWNCYVCDNKNTCSFASANRTLILDYTSPNLTLNSPTPEENSITNNSYITINLTLEDISNSTVLIDLNNSLVGWWRMNNESGESSTLVRDWSVGANNGTVVNATYTSDGNLGGCFEFDGEGDYIDVSSAIGSLDNFTISAWINLASTSDSNNAFFVINSQNKIIFQPTNIQVEFNDQHANYVTTNTVETWYHYAVVRNGTYVNYYKNGVLLSTHNVTTTAIDFSSFAIGMQTNDNSYPFNGSIDNVQIWNRALNVDEIQMNYRGISDSFNITNLINGNYSLKVYAQDSIGNVSSSEVENFEVWASPKIILNSPANEQNNLYRNTTLNITVIDYEGDNVNITFLNSANGIICQENNVASGSTVTCNYRSLQKETEYLWSLNITDGTTTTFESQNFTVGVSWEFTENYDNKAMSFVWTGDDWDGDSTRHQGFMNASDMAQRYEIWFSPGLITSRRYDGGGAPTWEEIQQQVTEGYVSVVSHSRNHYDVDEVEFNMTTSLNEANGSKNDIEGNLTLPRYNRFNNSQKMVGWIAPYYETHVNLTNALNMSDYLVHRGDGSIAGANGWAGFNESTGMYHDANDMTLTKVGAAGYFLSNFTDAFDDAYENGEQFHLMGHPGAVSANWSNGSVRDLLMSHISNRTDVWYVGWDHAYMYRYMTNQSLSTVNITSYPEDNYVEIHANASAEDRNKYALSYPITYEISVPTNWTETYVYYKNTSTDDYTLMENKTRDTVWNGIDAYRKDLENDTVYVSKAFPQTSNDMYLKLVPLMLDTTACSVASQCQGGYCVHGYCRSSSTYCGDGYCDSGETCSSCSGDCGECETTSGSAPTYTPSSSQLKEGYTKSLRKNQKVQVTINEQTSTVVVNSVDSTNKKVEVEIEESGKSVEINEGDVGKIDLDDDGYYDLQISCKEVRENGYADLEFKEIHEEVPAEEKERQESPSKFGIRLEIWIVLGIVLLIVIIYLLKWILGRRIKLGNI